MHIKRATIFSKQRVYQPIRTEAASATHITYITDKKKKTPPTTHYTHTMVTTFEIPKSPSAQLKTVLDYLEHVKALDLPELEKLFTDDFVQSTFPSSLNVPPRSKADDLAFLRGLAEQLQGRHLQVRNRNVTSLARRFRLPASSSG
jgi:hypothetical protein